MDRIEEEGMSLLAPLRDDQPDAGSGVDISLAMKAGRRHSRRRVLAGVAAAASVTALSMIGVSSLPQSLPDNTSPAGPVAEFSIARQAITVGTAGGYTPSSYRTGRLEQVVELKRADGGTGSGRVTAYAPGRQPVIDTNTPASDVNGRPAYWQPDSPDPTLAVRDGEVWVIVQLSGPDHDLVDRAHHVAQSVVFAADTPVTVPFTKADGLPGTPQLRVVGVQVSTDRPAARLLLATADTAGAPMLAIVVSPDPPDSRAPTEPLNDHQAVVDSTSVTILDVDGHGATVSVRYDDPARIGGIQALKDLAASVKLVPNMNDRSTWQPSPWK